MKKHIIKLLLRILNTQWLNPSPCEYGFIGNIDAFSYANLASEEKQQPGITVKQVLEHSDMWRSCKIGCGNGLKVIEDGKVRDGDVWDLHELKQAFNPTEKP